MENYAEAWTLNSVKIVLEPEQCEDSVTVFTIFTFQHNFKHRKTEIFCVGEMIFHWIFKILIWNP